MNLPFRLAAAAACCCVTVLFTGCALSRFSGQASQKAELSPVLPAPSRQPSAADSLLTDLARLQALPPAELARQREAARDTFERDPALFRRSHYLMTIFVGASSPADDERLLALVEPLLQSTDDATRVFGNIVQNAAATRKRIRDEATQVQRNRIHAANRRDDREPEVRLLKQRVEDLEKQLVAIKSIDRSLTRR